jgi:hypothetical protein
LVIDLERELDGAERFPRSCLFGRIGLTDSKNISQLDGREDRSQSRVFLKPCLNTLASPPAKDRMRGGFFVT